MANLWDPGVSWSEVSLPSDWDYFVSHASSLRSHLYDRGEIPLWNTDFCGGTPELGNPLSWAFGWPSLFVYALPPVPALLALWACLTALGAACLHAWLRRNGVSRLSSATGAAIYAFGGYFAGRFNQGLTTFAFLHIVPALILSADAALDAAQSGRPGAARAPWVLFALTTFLFFSGALPSALIFGYPAFLLFLLVRGLSRATRRRTLASLAGLHAAGIAAAAYKLGPVLWWQSRHPRQGVIAERIPLTAVLSGLVDRPQPFHPVTRLFPGQSWGGWEYHSYVGYAALLLALAGLAAALGRGDPRRVLRRFALASTATGTLLALGNAHPFSPSRLFHLLPFLNGVRVFARYEFLVVLGVAILAALGLEALRLFLERRRFAYARGVERLAAAAVLLPILAQTARLVRDIPVIEDSELRSFYALQKDDLRPKSAWQKLDTSTAFLSHQDFLLRHHAAVVNCYDPLGGLQWRPSAALQERMAATGTRWAEGRPEPRPR